MQSNELETFVLNLSSKYRKQVLIGVSHFKDLDTFANIVLCVIYEMKLVEIKCEIDYRRHYKYTYQCLVIFGKALIEEEEDQKDAKYRQNKG